MVNESKVSCLAVDLGASSGRVMGAILHDGQLELHEIHRFNNEPDRINGSLTWRHQTLFEHICSGLNKALTGDESWSSIALDTWGVDFALLDKDNRLIGAPVHYRDERTHGVMERVFEDKISRQEIFDETGIQFMPINTIYQLAALREKHPGVLERARRFMMMGDLFSWMLTGELTCEFTNATTSQLFNPNTRSWSTKIIDALDLPHKIFPETTEPGTRLGNLKSSVAKGAERLELIAAATHDTGSAVAAVPSTKERFAYLSCGTWSLLGTEISEPVVTEKALEYNFTNEGGVYGTWRLLKNIMGLWILQESQAQWQREGQTYSWSDITAMGQEADPFRSLIDPDDLRFLDAGNMPSRIKAICKETNQPIPESDSQVVRCVLESLALKYRFQLNRLEDIIGHSLPVIHMVGGGIQNELLCQWTANACDRETMAGPVEATALGNVGVQLIAGGHIKNLAAFRELVARSEPIKTYHPEDSSAWNKAFDQFKALIP